MRCIESSGVTILAFPRKIRGELAQRGGSPRPQLVRSMYDEGLPKSWWPLAEPGYRGRMEFGPRFDRVPCQVARS